MAQRLTQYLNSKYIAATSRLTASQSGGRQRIVAYVESYDDVLFWNNLLREVEGTHYRFDVMLPSRQNLSKGKKAAIMNQLGPQLGNYMIACVDADYDYVLQDTTPQSAFINKHPYVFHTYAYSIENLQCYAPALQAVCVMATLNDEELFAFEPFLSAYSQAIWPLLVWNIWCYRHGQHKHFDLTDFARTIQLDPILPAQAAQGLEQVRRQVNKRIAQLQRQFPQARSSYKPLLAELESLGLTADTAYLYMRGHDLFDQLIAPLVQQVCEQLQHHRERSIYALAVHEVQRQNELSAYRNATLHASRALKRHEYYRDSPIYLRICNDVAALLAQMESGQSPEIPPLPLLPTSPAATAHTEPQRSTPQTDGTHDFSPKRFTSLY